MNYMKYQALFSLKNNLKKNVFQNMVCACFCIKGNVNGHNWKIFILQRVDDFGNLEERV